ncbi:alpha/beta fold hydrolase [Legionella shakespearei]|uniref:Pimeloyl-[acyl-carrier protein] methyl ester esterase n=1 Tax=Legionella shakespearei DSM 23087 TaxID=1122169 RepID=A0A0W0YVR6_9GAMM|nr:alpha/beta fold hydrolase [Legionella shakespearei]KTD60952.1 biotin biosynthesis protein BioH [Legionella shakespearei DSM 23087]
MNKVHLTQHGKGKPLVLFHGWGFDSEIWRPLIPHLEHCCEVYLVDLPGFGHTPMMDWESFKGMLLSHLPEQFALAGWSMGGLYATRLAIEATERLSCLININSSPRFIMDDAWPGVSKEVFINFYNNLSTNLDTTLNEFIALQLKKTKAHFSLGKKPSQEGLASGLHILDHWDFRESLKKLSLPTCYMFGRLDPITPAKTMATMQLLYPDFKYILFNKSAHMPFLSHTEDFISEIKGFIQ